MDEARVQSRIEHRAQLRVVRNDAPARAGQRVSGADDQRISCRFRKRHALLDIGDDRALGDGFADLLHLELKALPVFGEPNRFDRRTEQLDAVARKYARLIELDGEIEAGLAAQSGKQRIGALARDDLFDRLRR